MLGLNNNAYLLILYVIVISRARGMYGIYYAGCEAVRGLSAKNAMHPSARDITILYLVAMLMLSKIYAILH